MIVRGLRPVHTFITLGAVLAAALAFLLVGNGVSNADPVFNPTTGAKLCKGLPSTFPDTDLAGPNVLGDCTETAGNRATGATSNSTTTLDIPGGQLNFSSVVTFTPAGTTITDGDLIPAGTKLGGLRSLTNLGLLNGACNTALVVDFILYNTALPDDTGDPRASSNIAFPRNEGQSDRFGRWAVGAAPPDGGQPGTNNVTDGNADLKADSTTLAIQNYPSYLLDLFDSDFIPGIGDGPNDPLIPLAVYGGLTNVSSTWVPLYFAQFSAGQLVGQGGQFDKMYAEMGQPNVSVLNDPTAVQISTSSISDFCSPLNVTTTLLGKDPSGVHTRAANQSTAGTALTIQYIASLRDLDNDGYENSLDTCPKTTNEGNPTVTSSEGTSTDNDGIDGACDPTPATNTGTNDHDGDLFQNRQDNCPLVANGTTAQKDNEVAVTPAAADGGGAADTIGDACDTGSWTGMQNGVSTMVTLSPNVSNGRYIAKTNVVATCIGGTDADSDGWCTDLDDDLSVNTRAQWSGGLQSAVGFTTSMDTDGDTFSDALETWMGTDATKKCAADGDGGLTPALTDNEGPLDNLPYDFNDDRATDLSDVLKYNTPNVFGQEWNALPAPSGAPRVRYDLNGDGLADLSDVLKYNTPGVFGSTCTPATPFQQ